MSKKFTVRASRFDPRDKIYTSVWEPIPNEVDLRSFDTPIETQGPIGSCVGAAIVAGYELGTKIQFPERYVDLSKLYVYYHARLLSGSENVDYGAYIREGLKGVSKFGICTEALWPYDVNNVILQPNLDCYIDGWTRKVAYRSTPTIANINDALAKKLPIVVGINVFDNFTDLTATNPIVTEPDSVTDFGGHAMAIVGYSLIKKWFIAKNSYGSAWGENGYCYIPFDYFSQYSFEGWCLLMPPPDIL